MANNFLLINATDYLLINAAADRLIISTSGGGSPIRLILDGDSILTGTRTES